MNKLLLVLAVFACAEASAQSHAHAHGGSAQTETSSYAGEEARDIKALSAQEQRAWLEGKGLGLAKAAELNSFPGPMHVLENAKKLALSASQEMQTRELMLRHKAEVRELGAEVVAAERRLDDLFRSRRVTSAEVGALTQQLGSLQARIRAAHLSTHLEQTAFLGAKQIAAYDELRGYAR